MRDRWILVVGASVARFLYAALLALANGTDPAPGWPTHRVLSGTCMAHVIANGSQVAFGYYHPGCTLRWKGACNDNGDAQSSSQACMLDFRVAATRTRLTFQWVSYLRSYSLRHLKRRLEALRDDAGHGPDMVVASIGHWDLMHPKPETCPWTPGDTGNLRAGGCCAAMQQGTAAIDKASGALVSLLHGISPCPRCSANVTPLSAAGYGCAAWGHTLPQGGDGWSPGERATHACAERIAADHRWVFADVGHLTASEPQGILGSPCGSGHHFGVLADAQALVFASLLPLTQRRKHFGAGSARSAYDAAERTAHTWGARGLGSNARLMACASDAARCELPEAIASQLADEEQVLRNSKSLEAGQHAGLCRETGGRSGHADCSRHTSGWWAAKRNNITSLASCVARCRGCRNCRFVSFSRAKAHDECAWYTHCDLNRLMPPPETGRDYATVGVPRRIPLGRGCVATAPTAHE